MITTDLVTNVDTHVPIVLTNGLVPTVTISEDQLKKTVHVQPDIMKLVLISVINVTSNV
jgi:hypothetical protein